MARQICQMLTLKGTATLVSSKHGTRSIDGNLHSNDDWVCTEMVKPADLAERLSRVRNAHVFIDDAGRLLGHNPEWQEITSDGRHDGHCVWVISQRYKMVGPNIRTNCTRKFVFVQEKSDSAMMNSEINSEFGKAHKLLPGTFLYHEGPGFEVKLYKIFDFDPCIARSRC